MPFSIKCRKILLSNAFYATVFSLSIFFVLFSYLFPKSIEDINETHFTGTIVSKIEGEGTAFLTVKGKRNLEVVIYAKTGKEKNFLSSLVIGDHISFEGKIERIKEQYYNFYTQSFVRKMARKKIYYRVIPTKITVLDQKTILNTLKKTLYQFLSSFKTNAYLKTFLLGDTSLLSKQQKRIYQSLGISHLFALSGLHVSFLMGGLFTFLKKMLGKERVSFFITLLFLLFYNFLVQSSPSIVRASLFFLCFKGNQLYDFHIAPYQILIFLLACFLFWNPFLLEEVGFLYSYTIAASLILFQKKLTAKTYIKRLIKTAVFSFFVSLPITLYYQYEVNICSIFFNLFFVPFVSFIVFPLSFLTILFPLLEYPFAFFIWILETSTTYLANLSLLKCTFIKLPFWYYFVLFCLFYFGLFKKKWFFLYAFVLAFHFFIAPYCKEDRMTMLDVGQGDAFLFESQGKALLLDTGGKEGHGKIIEQDAHFLETELKARGITHLFLAFSHGDQDHMGNALYLLKHFNIDAILTNLGGFTKTEKAVFMEARKRNIPFEKAQEGTAFFVGNFYFQQLNHAFEEENDSSAVYLVTYQNRKMLFLGDASIKTEEALLNRYEIPDLTILKVGHHGSKTSTKEALLKERKVELALISSGRKNTYHHPSPVILSRLEKFAIKTFNTQDVGSVEIVFPNLKRKTALS